MANLSSKQITLLTEMDSEQLVSIICNLVANNKEARALLINDHLVSAEDMLALAVKEYTRKSKSKRYYNYYQTDALFAELRQTVAYPLEKTAIKLPEQTECAVIKIIKNFSKLTERVDTSSGSWMDYYTHLLMAWLTSLTKLKNQDPAVIASKIMSVYSSEDYFDIQLLDQYKITLGFDTLRELRALLCAKGEIDEAVEISFFIRDIDFLRQALHDNWLNNPGYLLNFAQLLIDDLATDQAIHVLQSADHEFIKKCGYQDRWYEVYCQALLEDGRREEAKAVCIDAFKINCNVNFYNFMIKIDDSDKLTRQCVEIARQRSFAHYVYFLASIHFFHLIDPAVINAGKQNLTDLLNHADISFVRKLSNELHEHDYDCSAILLRRFLIEQNINRKKCKYYDYAVSDLKKSIQYAEKISVDVNIESTESYIQRLYQTHKEKSKFWMKVTEKIPEIYLSDE